MTSNLLNNQVTGLAAPPLLRKAKLKVAPLELPFVTRWYISQIPKIFGPPWSRSSLACSPQCPILEKVTPKGPIFFGQDFGDFGGMSKGIEWFFK